MQRRLIRVGVFAAVTLIGACAKGSGSGSGSGPTSPGPNATPSNSDWTTLAAQLVGIGVDSLQVGVVFPSGSTVFPLQQPGSFRTLALVSVPGVTRTWTTGYFCCGVSATTKVTVTGTLQVQSGGGATLAETIAATGTSDWKTAANAPNWMLQLPPGGMQITCDLATSGGAVQPSQAFQLAGTLSYVAANQTQSTSIDARLAFTDYQAGTGGVATGQVGPVNESGGPVSPPITPSPCSLPREGCAALGGPGPNGDAPCTRYPPCP